MLSKQEQDFINHWQVARTTYKKSFIQYIKGMSVGLTGGLAIIIIVASGWYQRANMQANAKLSILVFILALFCIAIFMGWLYRNYSFETKEQQYKELLFKQKQA